MRRFAPCLWGRRRRLVEGRIFHRIFFSRNFLDGRSCLNGSAFLNIKLKWYLNIKHVIKRTVNHHLKNDVMNSVLPSATSFPRLNSKLVWPFPAGSTGCNTCRPLTPCDSWVARTSRAKGFKRLTCVTIDLRSMVALTLDTLPCTFCQRLLMALLTPLCVRGTGTDSRSLTLRNIDVWDIWAGSYLGRDLTMCRKFCTYSWRGTSSAITAGPTKSVLCLLIWK